jgi:hypothetical protein
MLGDFPQYTSADGILIAVGAEKADHPLGLLEKQDEPLSRMRSKQR